VVPFAPLALPVSACVVLLTLLLPEAVVPVPPPPPPPPPQPTNAAVKTSDIANLFSVTVNNVGIL